jgi:hypothetical protein
MSCGNEVKLDDANTCVVGTLDEEMSHIYTFYKKDVVKGKLCPYCANLDNIRLSNVSNKSPAKVSKNLLVKLLYIIPISIIIAALLVVLI